MGGEITIFDANIKDDRDAAELKELREENKKLARALQDANMRAERATEDAVRAVSALRRQLTPLYRALQAVFGELDAPGIGDSRDAEAPSSPPAQDARVRAVWESWKSKLGGTVAKGIDALLLHGELDTAQLAIAAGLDKRTVTNTVVYKLNGAGLINKNGGRFSLKQL